MYGICMKQWYVYIATCADGTLYTGITTDLERRIKEHNTDNTKGANYTRGRRPIRLAYSECQQDRSSAAKREAAIKKITRKQKLELISR